ncbi:MAG: hypothetical protein U0821_18880 [Chloroflexota bacterium]
MDQEPSSNDSAELPAHVPAGATDVRATPLWSDVRGKLDGAVDSILEQIFSTTRQQALAALEEAEKTTAPTVERLESRRVALEREIAERTRELAQVTAELDGERINSNYRFRMVEQIEQLRQKIHASQTQSQEGEAIAARLVADRQAADLLESAQRRADEIVADAERRAAEIQQVANDRREQIISESQELQQRLRELDDRVSRLLSRPRPAPALPDAAPRISFAEQSDTSPTPGSARSPEPVSAEPQGFVGTAATASVPSPAPPSVAVESAAGSSAGLPVADAPRASTGEPAQAAAPVAETSVPSPPVVVSAPPVAVLSRAPQEAADVLDRDDAPAPSVVSAVVFNGVPGFQAALAIERAVKNVPGISGVTVVDFDDRKLTFQVAHTRANALGEAISDAAGLKLRQMVDRPDRVEFEVQD